jgi:hypothetical protein
MPEPIVILDPRSEKRNGRSRVSAWVDGHEVWFETEDAKLSCTGEAFGSAFLIPALSANRELIIGATTSTQWMGSASDIADVVTDWWDWENIPPLALERRPTARQSDDVALLFTGGVDSFHTLLESGLPISTLINVQGFDVSLADTQRIASSTADVRRIAETLGIRAISVRTNLRGHPTFAEATWEQSHGGALFAVGHLLRSSVGVLAISSSVQRSSIRPWGSDWRIDRFFSSEALTVEHFGDKVWRFDKLEQIANDPLVRRYLRVCWEYRSAEANCSYCDKCLRTMITLQGLGRLDGSERFDNGPIAERIRANPPIVGPGNRREYLVMLERGLDPDIAAAIEEALDRSVAPSPVTTEYES